jgi:predicted phage terminase large subunit-like protein
MAVTLISKADKEELVEHYLTHIYDFAQDFLPHFLMNKTPEFHKEIYELLTTESFLSLSAPRGFAKSTVCSIIFPIWAGLFKWKGDITLVSASEDFVVREITSKIRNEFETNKRLIKVFGDLKTPQWSASYFKLKNGIAYEAVGINGQLRGGRRGVIVLDDIENIESVLSEEQRTKIKDRINKELIPKLLPDSTCVFIGTIIHPLCYLNQVLKTEKNGWTKREYRAYRNTKATDAAGQRGGNELWPEMWNHKSLQARKAAIGSSAFASEYLNDPVSDGSQPIKDTNIKYWENLPEKLSYYICLDPAYREETKSDFKVAVVVGVDGQNNRYLVEYIRTHDPLGTYIDNCLDLYGRYKANCVKFAVPGGREIDFYNKIKDQANQSGIYPPFDEVKYIIRDAQTNRGMRDKHSRIIRSLQPLFEAGKYYIHANHKEAYEELLTFANGSLHDDVVDAMSGCEQFIQPLFSYEQVEADAVNAQFWKEYQAQGEEEQGLSFMNIVDTESSNSPGDSGYGDY